MNLERLLNPKSIALYGGKWADIVAAQCRRLGFAGPIWQVSPRRAAEGEAGFVASLDEISEMPDAAFVAVPKEVAVEVAGELARRGVGGMVCFASGFNETGSEVGVALTERLVAETGTTPFLGPNCYGFINYLDRVSLWPDEIQPQEVERGVGIVSQSGTIAITLSQNQRSLPIGYVVSAGNQARVTVDDLMLHMAADPRITAIGLYLEGVRDAGRFVETVEAVRAAGKPIALVKAGRTEAAANAALTHTGSLSGSDAVFDALCHRLGIARCDTLAELCETLKLLHQAGPLAGNRVLVAGASGGDMAMTADLASGLDLDLAPMPEATVAALREITGDRLVYANPFDMNTYSWYDHDALARQFRALSGAGYDAIAFMLDTPDPATCDPSAFVAAIDVFLTEAAAAGQRACMLSSLPEGTPKIVRERVLAAGATPLQGLSEGLAALVGAARIDRTWRRRASVSLVAGAEDGRVLTEHEAKSLLAAAGVPVPPAIECPIGEAEAAAAAIGSPVAVKISSPELTHKTEAGGVALGLASPEAAGRAARAMAGLGERVLVERMVADGVAEILVGLTSDPQFGLALVIGSGGTMTELFADAATLLFPLDREEIERALAGLTVAPLLSGFRGRPPGDAAALVEAILAIGCFAEAHAGRIAGLDVNPLIVGPEGNGVVAADALMKLKETSP